MPQLYFAMPDNAINSMELSSGSDPAALISALLSASAVSPFTLSMNVSYNLTVYSPNYFDIQIKSIKTDLVLIDSNGAVVGGEQTSLTGESNVGNENFSRLANTTITPFLIIKYSRNIPVSNGISDAVLSHLYNACVNLDNKGTRKLVFLYNTVVDVKLISFTGYKPTVSGTTSVNCPDISSLSPSWNALKELPANFGLK